jgi:hypothetical protein
MMRFFSSPLRWVILLALLLATFWLYLQPQFLVMLAEQVWACF